MFLEMAVMVSIIVFQKAEPLDTARPVAITVTHVSVLMRVVGGGE